MAARKVGAELFHSTDGQTWRS